jgi:magnesium transporter
MRHFSMGIPLNLNIRFHSPVGMAEVYILGKDIRSTAFSRDNVKKALKLGQKVWIDLVNPTKEQVSILKDIFNLHPVTVEDILHRDTRIKVETFNSYVFIVMYGICDHKKMCLEEIDFVLGKNFIITTHLDKVKSFEAFKEDAKTVAGILLRGADFMFYKLLDATLDNYYPVIDNIDVITEEMEKEVALNPKKEIVAKIAYIRKRVTEIKRAAVPAREKLSMLTKGDIPFISKEVKVYLRDVYDNSVIIAEELENHREVVTMLFEIYMSSLSNKLNEIMKVLSIIATIMMPLTFIASIYGMNFSNIPLLSHPGGFWVAMIVMAVLLVIMVLYFKMREWI